MCDKIMVKNARIVHISTVRSLSDVRLFHLECCSLVKAGYSVSLIIHDDSGKLDIEGVSIKSIGKPHPLSLKLRLRYRLRAILRAARSAMSVPAKIYHLHDPELIPVGHWLRLFTGAKIVYDCREDYINYIKIRPGLRKKERLILVTIMKVLEWSAAKFFDAIVTADQGTAANYQKLRAPMITTLYNFPRLDRFPKIKCVDDNNGKIYDLVYFGSISSYYLNVAFGIASEIKKRGRKATWLYFGNIEELDWARSEIGKRGLEDFFTFEGYIQHDQVAAKLRTCKIGIVHLPDLPKFRNNISQKLFEFMAMGMPVVLSDLPGNRQFVKKSYAILVPPDDYKTYADAIIYLLDNHLQRKQMGFAGRQHIEREYNWEKEFPKLQSLYSNLSPIPYHCLPSGRGLPGHGR